jgi:hypothetical protein
LNKNRIFEKGWVDLGKCRGIVRTNIILGVNMVKTVHEKSMNGNDEKNEEGERIFCDGDFHITL